MKKRITLMTCMFMWAGVLGGLLLTGCASEWGDRDFRQDMRDFVTDLSEYGKAQSDGFIIIPQNGQDLSTQSGDPDGEPAAGYLAAIDGQGREDLYYGYSDDNVPTPEDERLWISGFLELQEEEGVEVLVTDYCSTTGYMEDSYQRNNALGFISFAADERDLNGIPDYPADPYNANSRDITSLADADNFLYLINPENYSTKSAFLAALQATDYDLILIDLFYENDTSGPEALTKADITSLKVKENGASRLVICYMSIGEAEDYRYYWDESWDSSPPEWLERENPAWEGNYKVRYWDEGWQNIIFGSEDAYLDRVITAGFDGVYLDIIDAFEYFE